MLTPEQFVLSSILLCLGGALLVIPLSRNKTVAGWWTFFVTTLSAALIGSAICKVLVWGPSLRSTTFWSMPGTGFALRIHVDGLTAIFLLLTVLIGPPSALYSILYMRRYHEYGVARYYPYFLIFLAAMYGLLSTTDMMWFFFIFWQMMTLPGYALIRYEHRRTESVRAGTKFLLMMEIACAATMIGAELLAVTGALMRGVPELKYDFDTVSANVPLLMSIRPMATTFAFALFLVGFGIKMGMWPFGQGWLPDAHPAAPSPVSALLSGVMIKTGVYGLMRYFLWLVPPSATSYPLGKWGMAIAILGTITLFTGTMQALKQEQSKRLLAFHSIGQVGYILLGTGCSAALLSAGQSTLAAIAFLGALLHVLNHGLFKSLLFLNAGSMLYATDTQDLNKMGGLMKFMPLTAITGLVASLSISGVPLFNGFVSKWCIYAAAIQGNTAGRYLPICAVVAILTSALTLASFVKFFGVSFLCRSSALVKAQASTRRLEVPWLMQLPQVFLAVLCVGIGIAPVAALMLIHRALDMSPQGYGTLLAHGISSANGSFAGIGLGNGVAVFMPVVLLAVIGVSLSLAVWTARLGKAPRRAATPWLCGYTLESECNRYVAHNFYGEIKRYFGWLGGMPSVERTPVAGRLK